MTQLFPRLMANASCHDAQVTAPTVSQDCRSGFDFTVYFEEAILCILPSAAYLLSGTIESAYMLWKGKTLFMKASPLQMVKLAANVAFAVIQIALIALWSLHPLPSTSLPLVSSIMSP
ncbi:hypothetical protein VHEMI03051 [[Torrubiella] hemipterigena]|uniref:Uncharacterized protein n=1 Tax=[Torrubiella] hemipterigena TaxID=1531966 RepID=A0A0A1T9Q4_9HYPO|nr:hypothetical protein VHEMI03051 [[Torrubiella] hemipterigena]